MAVQIVKLLVIHFYLGSCYFFCLTFSYFPQRTYAVIPILNLRPSFFFIQSFAYVIRCYKNCFNFILYEFCSCGPLIIRTIKLLRCEFWGPQ